MTTKRELEISEAAKEDMQQIWDECSVLECAYKKEQLATLTKALEEIINEVGTSTRANKIAVNALSEIKRIREGE